MIDWQCVPVEGVVYEGQEVRAGPGDVGVHLRVVRP